MRARSSSTGRQLHSLSRSDRRRRPTAPEDTPVAIPSFVGLSFEQAQATAKSLGVTVEKNGTALR